MAATKAILVTGASSGIGRLVTERLAAEGCLVYAGARSDNDIRALASIKNVHPLRLDVTRQEDIVAAVDVVACGRRGLYGLVNNAGVATFGSVKDTSAAEFDLVMRVNVHGPYCVTQAFAAHLIAARGRVVNIGSISGILAAANLSAYCMSKHAVEALTDSLAEEMLQFGVSVSVIEPSNFNTRIASNAIERLGSNPGLPDLDRYQQPHDVVDAVMLALFETMPKLRYLVVSHESEARETLRKQIGQLVQLNEGHTHTLGRSDLIAMLDEALGRARSPNDAQQRAQHSSSGG